MTEDCITTWLRAHSSGLLTECIHPRRVAPGIVRDSTALCIVVNVTELVRPPTYREASEISHVRVYVDVYSNDAEKLLAVITAVLDDLNGALNVCDMQGLWLDSLTDVTFEDPLFRYRKRLTFLGAL